MLVTKSWLCGGKVLRNFDKSAGLWGISIQGSILNPRIIQDWVGHDLLNNQLIVSSHSGDDQDNLCGTVCQHNTKRRRSFSHENFLAFISAIHDHAHLSNRTEQLRFGIFNGINSPSYFLGQYSKRCRKGDIEKLLSIITNKYIPFSKFLCRCRPFLEVYT